MSRAGQSKRKEKKKALERLGELLEIPAETVLNLPHIELSGNREFLIENYRGIVEYGDEVVKINGGKLIIKLSGSGFQLKSMAPEMLVLAGRIKSIEFIY